jgi:TonB family protein
VKRICMTIWILFLGLSGSRSIAQVTGPLNAPPQNTTKPLRMRVGPSVPRVALQPMPTYPQAALDQKIEGIVVLHTLIAGDGTVKDISAVSGSDILSQSAIETVKRWQYQTAQLNGIAVEMDTMVVSPTHLIAFDFQLLIWITVHLKWCVTFPSKALYVHLDEMLTGDGIERSSGILDFTEKASGDVVDETADSNPLLNPRMCPELLQLVTDILFDVLERVEKRGSNHCGSGAILNSGSQVLFAGLHQSAVRVIDDHDLLGAQQIVGYNQRTQRVIRNDAASIADDMCISRL